MACSIYCKILLALVLCITVQGNSAYFPTENDYWPRPLLRKASQGACKFPRTTIFSILIRFECSVLRSAGDFSAININFDPRVDNCFAFTRTGQGCLAEDLPSCIKLKLYKYSVCREHVGDVRANTPFGMLGHHQSFKVDSSECESKTRQDMPISPINQEAARVQESQEPTLTIPIDYPEDSQSLSGVLSRWFQVKLQEFQRTGNRLTRV